MATRKKNTDTPAPDTPTTRPIWGLNETREAFEARLSAYTQARNARIAEGTE